MRFNSPLDRLPVLQLLVTDRRGATLAEYSLVAVVVLGATAAPMANVGDAVVEMPGQDLIAAVAGEQAATPSSEFDDDTPIAADPAGAKKIQEIPVEGTGETQPDGSQATREA